MNLKVQMKIEVLSKEQGYFCEACPAVAQKRILFIKKESGDIISQRYYCKACTDSYLEQRSELDLEAGEQEYHFRSAML